MISTRARTTKPAERPAEFEIWTEFQPEPGQCELAERNGLLDIWRRFQPEPGQYDPAERTAHPLVRTEF